MKEAIKVSLAELLPLLQETIEQGGQFSIPITGNSMRPTLVPRRDRVFLQKASQPLKKLDVPLYRRDNGDFILHRIVSVQPDGTFVCCGDHQLRKESGVRPDQIIAVAAAFERKGKRVSVKAPVYRAFSCLWVGSYFVRRVFVTAGVWVKRFFRRLIGK